MHRRQAGTSLKGQNAPFSFDQARSIGHSGGTRGSGSSLNLFPEHGMDTLFAFNAQRDGGAACGIVSECRRQFLARFFR